MPSSCPVEDDRSPDEVVVRAPKLQPFHAPAWVREYEDAWCAWCPCLDVMTQARTKTKALKALQEAVDLWVESCIARGVLEKVMRVALAPIERKAVCSECGVEYLPKRQPNPNRLRFCDQCKKASWKHSKRRLRDKAEADDAQ